MRSSTGGTRRVNLPAAGFIRVVASALTIIAFGFHATPAAAQAHVSMPNPPVALDPDLLAPEPGGVFDGRGGRQAIGVFLRNDDATPIRNAVAVARAPAGSGIKLTSAVVKLGTLRPRVPTLALIRADLRTTEPGLYRLSFTVTGDAPRGSPGPATLRAKTSRRLFVVRAQADPSPGTGGTVFTHIGQVSFGLSDNYGGQSLGSLSAATAYRLTLAYNKPYGGPSGNPPPIAWKVIGGIGISAGVLAALVIKACGPKKWGTVALKIAGSVIVVSVAVALADAEDPFSRGEAHTFPLATERTTKEEVAVRVSSPAEPLVGTRYPLDVSWDYTRTTSEGREYPYSIREPRANKDHSTSGRRVSVKRDGDRVTITASTRELRNNRGWFVAAMLPSDDETLGDPIASIVLRDDGHGADKRAGDRVYTGATRQRRRKLKTFVLGYDLAPVEESAAPETAVGRISGFLVSPPRFTGKCSMVPDGEG